MRRRGACDAQLGKCSRRPRLQAAGWAVATPAVLHAVHVLVRNLHV